MLDIGDFNRSNGTLKVDNRFIKLEKNTLNAINTYIQTRRHPFTDDEQALFLTKDGTRISKRQLQKQIKIYINIAFPNRSDNISIRDFRKNYLITNISNEEPSSLEKRMGYKSNFLRKVKSSYSKKADSNLEQDSEALWNICLIPTYVFMQLNINLNKCLYVWKK